MGGRALRFVHSIGCCRSIKAPTPRVLYVSLGETDDWAHAGRYDRYLLSARQNDALIKRLWDTCQSIDQYQGKTTFIVSSDHGRGDGREGWKNHSVDLPGSERIWIAAFGTGIAAHGIDQGGEFTQSQIAATAAKAVGMDYPSSDSRIAKAYQSLQSSFKLTNGSKPSLSLSSL